MLNLSGRQAKIGWRSAEPELLGVSETCGMIALLYVNVPVSNSRIFLNKIDFVHLVKYLRNGLMKL